MVGSLSLERSLLGPLYCVPLGSGPLSMPRCSALGGAPGRRVAGQAEEGGGTKAPAAPGESSEAGS